MKKHDEGEQAHPVRNDWTQDDRDMSLWDYYAGQAMQGLISCLSTKFACSRLGEEMNTNGHPSNRTEWTITKCAADYADAMITEKRKREGAIK